jgi:hypothetical protein
LFGLYGYPLNAWPVPLIRGALFGDDASQGVRGTYGEAGRLIAYPGKAEVPCPAAGPDTAVVLAIGQSNIANHSEKRVTSRYRSEVVNFFGGKCYRAASPLLGATGEEGEFLTLLGDRLLDDGAYHSVVIVSSAIGASGIAMWRKGGVLNGLLLHVLNGLPPGYRITEVLWLQGETDAAAVSPEDYTAAFRSLLDTLADGGVTGPVFLSVATRCFSAWKTDNPTAGAQRLLVDGRRVFLGADTDALLADADRRPDGCHFGASGQEKAASAFAEAIERVRSGGAPRSAAPSPSGR